MSDIKYSVDLRDLLEAGCHFGHQARRWNPKMKEYIYAEKDGVHIFDLGKTGPLLEEAMNWVKEWVASGKEIIFVGTKRQAQAIVREEATNIGAPFISERWLGGVLTNWEMTEKRIKKLNDMKIKKANGDFGKYTKKENVMIDKEIAKLERFFGGIAHLKVRPEAIFVVDTHREKTAIAEAALLGVTVVGMVDSNADPDSINYPIPVNDDAVRSIKLVVSEIAKAYADGKAIRNKA
jgi:small subunit ribosomal protein S2